MTKKSIDKKIKKWSDKEALEAFAKMMHRVNLITEFVETEEGLITGEYLIVSCGDSFFISTPREFDWPLQRMPMPDAFKEKLN